jgi:hypothetical protein
MLIAILISRLGGNEMIEQLNRKAIQLTFRQGRTFMRFEFSERNFAIFLREQTIGNWPAYTAVIQSSRSPTSEVHTAPYYKLSCIRGNAFDL